MKNKLIIAYALAITPFLKLIKKLRKPKLIIRPYFEEFEKFDVEKYRFNKDWDRFFKKENIKIETREEFILNG